MTEKQSTVRGGTTAQISVVYRRAMTLGTGNRELKIPCMERPSYNISVGSKIGPCMPEKPVVSCIFTASFARREMAVQGTTGALAIFYWFCRHLDDDDRGPAEGA